MSRVSRKNPGIWKINFQDWNKTGIESSSGVPAEPSLKFALKLFFYLPSSIISAKPLLWGNFKLFYYH